MKYRYTHYLATALLLGATSSHATIVEIDTSMGKVQVNLYDDTTPATVENFLNYVNNSDYNNVIFHRSVPGFVVQGGGFVYDFTPTLGEVNTNAPVVNEPVYSNVRGTIAMAKLAGDPNSADSQFFFNLVDNSANLDGQNGGFSVFGQVVAGMEVVDAISELPRTGDFGGLPLRNFPPADTTDFVPTEEHYVLINTIDIIDAATDTATGLTRPLTTVPADNNSGNNSGNNGSSDNNSNSSSGGGNMGFAALMLLGLVCVRRRLAACFK